MKHTPFSLDALAKPKTAPKAKPAAKRKPAAKAKSRSNGPPWQKEFFEKLNKVREALGDEKLV